MAPLPPLSPPLPGRRVLLASDSMLRPLERLSWPAPFDVTARCFSGAGLETVVKKCLALSGSRFDVVVLHAGVNDASGGASLESDFRRSCDFAARALRARFSDARVVVSLACLSASEPVNVKVAVVNRLLREFALAQGFCLISNDNIRITDLTDVVHLNAAGTARIYGSFFNCLCVDAV